MHLPAAQSALTAALARMNAAYQDTVFDEWVVVALDPQRGTIMAYHGPRGDSFRRQFAADVQPLRAAMTARAQAVGDFDFAHDAAGTRYDACLKTGKTSFLFCNNTRKSIDDIRQDPRWLEAQKVFLDLSEKFRADPLE